MIITLIALLLVTLLVVSLSSMVGLERATTHSSFENIKAREFAGMAVDEVAAKLRDNIPTNNLWAVAPGRLAVFTSSSATNLIPLYSGAPDSNAKGSTGVGVVDLNAPILGTTNYPIIGPNAEYGVTPMQMAWVEVLQDGTLIRNPTTSNVNKSNPVIGRYAYWVDTETSKVNLNSAGKGQTAYNIYETNLAASDAQNLSGAPSRVDLSQLDGGISSAQSLAAYHYTYGSYFLGDKLTNSAGNIPLAASATVGPTVPNDTVGAAMLPQGGQTFNSIEEWPLMTNDLFTGAAITPVTSGQVEQNRFYLTARSRTPEVTPWGFNKLWFQANEETAPMVNQSGVLAVGASTNGNILNGKGFPIYPPNSLAATLTTAEVNTPNVQEPNGTYNQDVVPESRYYVAPNWPLVANNQQPDFQFAGQYAYRFSTAYDARDLFINNMMVQLGRKDWPGMSGMSFVDKYGQAECEDLAFNIYCLFWNSAYLGAGDTGFNVIKTDSYADYSGIYGSDNLYTNVDGQVRLLGGVGEWPYITQVSATFSSGGVGAAGTSGMTAASATTKSYYAGTNTYFGTTYYTKYYDGQTFGHSVGFAPVLSKVGSNPQPINLKIVPTIEVWYPPKFRNNFNSNGNLNYTFRVADVQVFAQGTATTNAAFPTAGPVTYGTNSTVDPGGLNHPYYWGMCDDQNNYNNAGLPNTNTFGMVATAAPGNFSSTNEYTTITLPPVFVGPFNVNTQVNSQIRFRVAMCKQNYRGAISPAEMVPLAYNIPTNSVNPEDQTFQNVMTGATPTFQFSGKNILLTTTVGGNAANTATFEVIDPREYRYLSDWTSRSGAIINGASSIYQSSFADTLTGVTGDDSKLAWPNTGAQGLINSAGAYGYGNVVDYRWSQFANNIVGLPSLGWLSVLPLNCEATQGTVGVGSNVNGSPVPWRTVSLEPSLKSNLVPDWLLFDMFAIAYDQTFCSQTQGEMNVNTTLAPYVGTISPRTKPLQALLVPGSYATTASSDTLGYYPTISAATLTSITNAVASYSGVNSGPCANMPSDMFMYKGQICQVSALGASGSNQLQREALMRDCIGDITTQSGDFKIHVAAQSVKQVSFTGNASTDLVPTGEQRMSALVSRVPNLGPDNIPDSGDEPYHLTSETPASSSTLTGTPVTTLNVNSPTFKYVISNVTYANN